jgi:hypothetical protein
MSFTADYDRIIREGAIADKLRLGRKLAPADLEYLRHHRLREPAATPAEKARA